MKHVSENTNKALEDRLLIADEKEQLMISCGSLCHHEFLCMNKRSRQKFIE